MANDAIHTNEDNRPALHPKDYDDLLKSIVCDWLTDELTLKRDKEAHTIGDEKLTDLKWRRRIAATVAGISVILTWIILSIMYYQIISPDSTFQKMEPLPQGLYISASFLFCIVIYGTIIAGLYNKTKQEPDVSPVKEAMDILQKTQSGQ